MALIICDICVIIGSIGGSCGGLLDLVVLIWWRRVFMFCMVWGVNLILMREGIVWVCWGGLEFVTWVMVAGWSGEVSIGLLAVGGCVWVFGVCSGGGGGVGSGGVQSGRGCVGLVLLGLVLLGTCRISLECLLFLTQGVKFLRAGLSGVKFLGAGLSGTCLACSCLNSSNSFTDFLCSSFNCLCLSSSSLICCADSSANVSVSMRLCCPYSIRDSHLNFP